jgi:F-type H+-transporting ATPase subunit epsilon
MNFFTVDILTPFRVIARNIPAESILIPTRQGQINVLPEHTHIITQLDTGTLSIFGDGDDVDKHFSISTGVCKVLGNKVVIMADICEQQHEIDFDRAKRALEFAQSKLNSTDGMSLDEITKFQRKVERARLRIQIAERYKAKS